MMASVFFAQPIGQLLANLLSYSVVTAFKSEINIQQYSCGLETIISFPSRRTRTPNLYHAVDSPLAKGWPCPSTMKRKTNA